MLFTGEFINKFDDAGRVSLPSKMRDELRQNGLNNSLMVYFAQNTGCLKILPKSEFEKIAQGFKDNPPATPAQMMAYRSLFASALPAEINASGRIAISSKHRENAGLKDECCIIGMGDYIEIWSKENRDKENSQFSDMIANGSDELDLTIF